MAITYPVSKRMMLHLALVSVVITTPVFAQSHTEDMEQSRQEQSTQEQQQTWRGAQSEDEGASASQSASSMTRARITADIETRPEAQLTAEERQALSQAAARLLTHVDKARQAFATQDSEGVRDHIAKGLMLARIIDRSVPTSHVNATIRAGGLVYQDQDTVKALNIPIYAEFGAVSILGPLQAAKQDATKGQNIRMPVVQEVELQHTTLTLDARMAKQHLKAARTALNNEHPQLADRALAAIQTSGVNFTYVEMDAPLIRTRENLTLAKTMIQQQQPAAARAALQEAKRALTAYGKRVDETKASQVQALQQQMTEVSQNLEQNQEGASEQISRLRDQVTQLVG